LRRGLSQLPLFVAIESGSLVMRSCYVLGFTAHLRHRTCMNEIWRLLSPTPPVGPSHDAEKQGILYIMTDLSRE
jgi:hypothetical protein